MAGAAKNAALAWAEKRKAQVEAAQAKKAQKEMGEVTSDHTFKPKLRSGKVSRSLASIPSVGSGKITPTEKPNLASPVLKRRAGDFRDVPSEVPPEVKEVKETKEVKEVKPRQPEERSNVQVRAGPPSPGVGSTRPSEPKKAAPAPRRPRSPGRASIPDSSPPPRVSSPPRPSGSKPRGAIDSDSRRRSSARGGQAVMEVPAPAATANAPTESEGAAALSWKDMTLGLRHWREDLPAGAMCFPDAPAGPPAVFSSNDLPDATEAPELVESEVPAPPVQSEKHPALEETMEAHLKLERLRQQLEEEQRQLEEEAQQLRQGGLVDAQKLQQLAEKQQQRLARFDKEHEQMEQSESAWVEDLADMPLPVITEQPELLEEFQSQHLEEFEKLQKQWQLEQAALQEKLQDQLQQVVARPQESKQKSPAVSKLAEQFQALWREHREALRTERREEEELKEMIEKFKSKCEKLESRVKEPTSPSLFGAFKEFWTSQAFAGGDGDWFHSTATKLADLMAPEALSDASRTKEAASEPPSPAPQERASSTRRWPPGPVR